MDEDAIQSVRNDLVCRIDETKRQIAKRVTEIDMLNDRRNQLECVLFHFNECAEQDKEAKHDS